MIYGLAEKIKTLRIQRNLSQVQLGELLNVTKSAVNTWEAGTNSPSLSCIIKLSQIFKVSTDYLLGVNERLTVDITHLDEIEREAVLTVINIFGRKK